MMNEHCRIEENIHRDWLIKKNSIVLSKFCPILSDAIE